MVNVPVIVKKELHSYFYSPIAYVVMTVFLVINGFFYWWFMSSLNNQQESITAVQLILGGTIIFWIVIIPIVAVITMRLLAEERKGGTLETLMTAPVTDVEVVLGKYIAAYLFYAILWLPTLIYVVTLGQFSEPDMGPIWAGYLGVLLMGAPFVALGLLMSSLTRNQIAAAILTIAALTMLFSLGLMQYLVTDPWQKDLFTYLNLWDHMNEFGKGIVDSRHIIYYISLTALSLFLTVRVVESRKGQ